MLFDGLLIYDFISFDYNFSFSEISVREIAKIKWLMFKIISFDYNFSFSEISVREIAKIKWLMFKIYEKKRLVGKMYDLFSVII